MTKTTDRKESEIGMIPQEWEVLKLGDLVNIRRGASPRPIIDYMTINSGMPWVKISDATSSQTRYIERTNEYIKEEGIRNSVVVIPGDLILSNSATPGLPKIMKIKACIHDGWLLVSNFKGITKEYLYYFFLKFREELAGSANGSVFQNLKTDIVRDVNIPLPPVPEQETIVNILGSLDDKIELLKEQNKTLESMGQTMFKSWFVNFDGITQFEDSELGQIPKGWKIYKLEEIVESINGYSYKGSELVESSEEALVTLKSFDRNGGFQTRGFKPFIGKPKKTQEVFVGDLVVAHTDLTQNAEVLGNPAFIFDDSGYKKLYITMDLVKVISKNEMVKNSFLYYLMKTEEFKGHCVGYSSGTTVLHLSKKAIPEFEIALPKELDLVKKFSESASEITNKITNNMYEIESLIQTRDNLLPRLISGKVRMV